jgi:hypothetical protein
MTVKELIERLAALDGSARVVLRVQGSHIDHAGEVTDVEQEVKLDSSVVELVATED